jgi:quercetin dioxygenase-like cupin family protein
MTSPLDPSRCDARPSLFGGEGTVRVWDLGGRVGALSAVLFCELEPGGRVGKHVQSHDDEVVIVLEGEAVIYVQGQPHACVKGSAVPLALGQTLEIDNASPTEPVRYLIVKATAKR